MRGKAESVAKDKPAAEKPAKAGKSATEKPSNADGQKVPKPVQDIRDYLLQHCQEITPEALQSLDSKVRQKLFSWLSTSLSGLKDTRHYQ